MDHIYLGSARGDPPLQKTYILRKLNPFQLSLLQVYISIPIRITIMRKCRNFSKLGRFSSGALVISFSILCIIISLRWKCCFCIEKHKSFWGLRPLDPHQGLCPWTPHHKAHARCALRLFALCASASWSMGHPTILCPTGTLKQSYANGYPVLEGTLMTIHPPFNDNNTVGHLIFMALSIRFHWCLTDA